METKKNVLCRSTVSEVKRSKEGILNLFLSNGATVVQEDTILAGVIIINKDDQVEIVNDGNNGTLCVSYGKGNFGGCLLNSFRVPKEAVKLPA